MRSSGRGQLNVTLPTPSNGEPRAASQADEDASSGTLFGCPDIRPTIPEDGDRRAPSAQCHLSGLLETHCAGSYQDREGGAGECSAEMDNSKASFRRTSSAGYRLPDRPAVGLTSHSSASVYRQQPGKTRSNGGGTAPAPDPDTRDPVKQDQVWREYIQTEWAGVKEWKKNWGFLTNYDQLGRPRKDASLPTYVPVFSDRVPNTTNQALGSRMCTDLGKALIRMDNLLLLNTGHRKTKSSPEMQPC
ncbi:hypothetical protein SKAU_G00419760 [Synaphobranchus kaupii]|uniref:Uncharacterized protein n=1 Tax=Synaphobranchus kaupii TaxID=118154 RepID=A0A9Q1E6D2_SYNKA|nr:hypothetical protein SKAU_G00419760 [Synaphobranchus kaupii]